MLIFPRTVVDCGSDNVMMRFTLFLSCFGLLLRSAAGQSTAADSTVSMAARQAIARHEQVHSSPEHLYNGPEYISYDRRLTGHPFFPTDTMLDGRVTYEGTEYAVPLLYDIVKDVVAVNHTSGYRVGLHPERVQQFQVKNRQFIRLDSSKQAMPTGFYELLYNGPTQLIARRTKVIVINPSPSLGYGLYDPRTTYYVRKNGLYTAVKTKRALLKLLTERRRPLAAYARQQKLRFRPSPETALLKLAQQYDALNRSL
jgi:hypothetical protein